MPSLDKSITLKHYKRPKVQHKIIEHARDKEVGVRYGDGFGKRPDILHYPREVLEFALRGVTSFHCSEENWDNPLAITSEMSRKDLDQERKGWDLVLDIDCAILEYSKITADLTVKFLEYCGVDAVSVKFSGNKGFHIGVPFEAFPDEVSGTKTKLLFPEAARKIAAYVTENIKEELARRILLFENNDISQIKEKVGLEMEKIVRYETNQLGDRVGKLHVENFLEIDTILISSRHLYRMPYSLHEKSGLVSIPIEKDEIMGFEKESAKPENINTDLQFMPRENVTQSARRLLVQALDFEVQLEEEREVDKEYEEMQITSPIREEFFPPCMHHMMKGLEDGKKRAIFCAMNYLGKIGWSKQDVEKWLKEWNKKNPEPLREVYIKGQMHSFKPGDKLPPNCNNEGYYKGIGICHPDGLCKHIKNPVNYTLVKWKSWLREKEMQEREGKGKKKEKNEGKESEESTPPAQTDQ